MTVKSCFDCPSYLTAEDARGFFGDEEILVPMCARFGKVLGLPRPVGSGEEPFADEKAVLELAKGCISFGKEKPAGPTPTYDPVLFNPRPELLKLGDSKDIDSIGCDGCAKSVYVRSTGMFTCAAMGLVVTTKSQARQSKGCMWKDSRSGVAGQVSVDDRDDYLTAFNGTSVTVKMPPAPKRRVPAAVGFIAGSGYDSDAPVDEKDQAMIRAFRKVVNPKNGREYFIPIFRTDFFSEEEQLLIPVEGSDHGDPSTYVDHSNLLLRFAVNVYTLDLNVVLVGEPGSGKTEGARFLAGTLNQPFVRLQYNEQSDPDQFLGMMEADDGRTYFNPGLLPEAWVRPYFVLSDEWNLAPEAIHQVYRAMNDASRLLTIYKNRFLRHDFCFHMGAINPSWDFRNIGAKALASADTRRLSFHWMPYPDDAMQKRIIGASVLRVTDEVIEDQVVKTMLRISTDLREMAKNGELPDAWTLSQDIKVGALAMHWGLKQAYRDAYFDSIDPVVAETAFKAIDSHIPSGVEWA